MTKIKVQNMTPNPVVLHFPDLRFSRKLVGNAHTKIDKEMLEEMIYDHGFKRLLDEGIIFIEDIDNVHEDLGIEPITVLSDDEIIKLFEKTDYFFKNTIADMPRSQLDRVIDLAIEKQTLSITKNTILKEIGGVDVAKIIELQSDVR